MRTDTLLDIVTHPAALGVGVLGLAVMIASSPTRMPSVAEIGQAPIVETVGLLFEDMDDGTVLAFDAATREQLAAIAPGEGGFVRVMMRGFASKRKQLGISRVEPFVLSRDQSGRLILSDPMTGRVALLDAFGDTNAQAFAGFLDHGRENQ